MSERSLERAHRRAREKGVCGPLYVVVRAIVAVKLRFWFRLRASGTEHLPAEGAAIIAANHKSFLDPFFLGLVTRRRLRWMAKVEIFKGPLARLLVRLGAFPIRRGAADGEAIETACALLEQGHVVVAFVEGTRVDEPDALGAPHHGAGRLALATGAPIVPTAISGTSGLFFGPFPKPRRIQIAFLEPVDAADFDGAPDALTELIDGRVWPAVVDEYGRLRATPGVIATALAAIGLGAHLATRGRPEVRARVLGTVDPRRVRHARQRHRRRDRLRRLVHRR